MKPPRNICKLISNKEWCYNKQVFRQYACERLGDGNELLYRKDLLAHFGCVNAIEFSEDGQMLISGGDDRRVMLWNTQKALNNFEKPLSMKREHFSNIFCLSFDNENRRIVSAGNDDQVILHDIETRNAVDVFKHDEPIYGVSMDPYNKSIFVTAGDDGRVLLFDIRIGTSNYIEAIKSQFPFHAVMFNPSDSAFVATANSKDGAVLWDLRLPNKEIERYIDKENCMNVRFNQKGDQLLALRRRQPPVLFGVKNGEKIVEFVHPEYYNSCTMKTCSFAGLNDEYILSGSDDFNIYLWKIPQQKGNENGKVVVHDAKVLRGHRSIVNQVRFHPEGCLIASSGVEKIIKIWSPLPLPEASKESKDWIRKIYTHEEYISLLLRSGQFMSHDYSSESVDEDPYMMAFFDSLVQREKEGENSDMSSDSSLDPASSYLDTTDCSSMSGLSDSDTESDNHSESENPADIPQRTSGRAQNSRSAPLLQVVLNESSPDSDDDSASQFSPIMVNTSIIADSDTDSSIDLSSSSSSASSVGNSQNNKVAARKRKLKYRKNIFKALKRLRTEEVSDHASDSLTESSSSSSGIHTSSSMTTSSSSSGIQIHTSDHVRFSGSDTSSSSASSHTTITNDSSTANEESLSVCGTGDSNRDSGVGLDVKPHFSNFKRNKNRSYRARPVMSDSSDSD